MIPGRALWRRASEGISGTLSHYFDLMRYLMRNLISVRFSRLVAFNCVLMEKIIHRSDDDEESEGGAKRAADHTQLDGEKSRQIARRRR